MFITSDWGKCDPAELIDKGVIRIYNVPVETNVDELEAHILKHCRNYEVISLIPPVPWANPNISCYKLIIEGNAREFIRHYKQLPEMPNTFLTEGKEYDLSYPFPEIFTHYSEYTSFDTKQSLRPPGWHANVPFIDIPLNIKQKYCLNVTNKPPQWDSATLKNAIESYFTGKKIWLHIYSIQSSPSYPNSAVIACFTLKTKSLLLLFNPLPIDTKVILELKSF